MTDSLTLIYCPFHNVDDAKKLAHMLLKEKLIVCANILPSSTSLYVWDGTLQENIETIALFKTTDALKKAAAHYIELHHSYDTPCILQFDAQANAAFEAWTRKTIS